MRTEKTSYTRVMKQLYCGVVIIGMTTTFDWLTRTGNLLVGAVPMAFGLIAALYWLDPRWQTGAWAVVGGWLLSLVFVVTGNSAELPVIAIVFVLTALGVFKSPWFLVALWFVHPVWDMVPRTLPPALHALPFACLLYDVIIGCFLVWATRTGRVVSLLQVRSAR